MTPEQKAKIIWRCKRGMLELDLIFAKFITTQLDHLSEKQLATFEQFLKEPDPDLYAWCMGYEQPTKKEYDEILQLIRYKHSPQ